jgi:hypothetical protein
MMFVSRDTSIYRHHQKQIEYHRLQPVSIFNYLMNPKNGNHDHRNQLNSLDNPSHGSSVTKPLTDTTRDILTRRRALDPIEEHDLKTYVHRRRNSIVQHVIGYNYDDNSIVGGLYTRVGIGSKLKKNI